MNPVSLTSQSTCGAGDPAALSPPADPALRQSPGRPVPGLGAGSASGSAFGVLLGELAARLTPAAPSPAGQAWQPPAVSSTVPGIAASSSLGQLLRSLDLIEDDSPKHRRLEQQLRAGILLAQQAQAQSTESADCTDHLLRWPPVLPKTAGRTGSAAERLKPESKKKERRRRPREDARQDRSAAEALFAQFNQCVTAGI